MAVELKDGCIVLNQVLAVEEAETLLELLQAQPQAGVDFSGCSHLHAACLQVLLALRPSVAAWPADAELAAWLHHSLGVQEGLTHA